jgi:nicotinamide-nucleotide amidase
VSPDPGAPSGGAAAVALEIATSLTADGETLAVAESASGGLIAAALVAVPGASAWFAGGAVAYNAAAKERWLGLTAGSFAPHGVVSRSGAEAMAAAVRLTLGTTWGLAEVGIAGPQTGRRSRKGSGLSYVAVGGPRDAWEEIVTGRDDRAFNQGAFALAALVLLRDVLRGSARAR